MSSFGFSLSHNNKLLHYIDDESIYFCMPGNINEVYTIEELFDIIIDDIELRQEKRRE